MESRVEAASGGQEQRWKEWEERARAYHVPRADVNKVVMEYLVKEGFKDVSQLVSLHV